MRKLFWILLLGNVALFAAMQQGWFGLGEQPSPAQPALNEHRIRLLDSAQNEPVAVLPASVPPVSPVADSPPAPDPVVASATVTAKAGTLICLEWGDFSGSDLARAKTALSALQLGDKLSQYQVEHDIGYWVYIPPLKSKASANRKVGELKALGVTEYFIVQSAGQWRNAISLGVFKSREAAQNFLDELRKKGVRTAQVGERASKFKVTVFRLNEVGILNEVKLTSMQKDFAGSELKHVPCALTR